MKKVLQFRIEEKVLDQFKEYCISKDITMSNILIDYIYTLLPKTYNCLWCGKNILDESKADRAYHEIHCDMNPNNHNS